MARSCRRRPGWPVRRAAAKRATSAAGPRGYRRPARSGPGLPRGTCRHRRLAARSRAAPPPRRARARSHPARSRAAAASTAISCVDIHQTYHRSGLGPAMAEFIALASHQGSIPPGFADQPAPNPADFGWPARDDGSRNDPLVGQNIMSCHRYQHDSGALRAASTRVVIAVAAESSTMTAGRAAVAVAGRLGTTPATFPGGHDGSPAANTAGRAIRTPPPPPCARPSPADSLPPPRRSPAPSARSSRTAAGEGQDTAKCANRPDRTTSATGVSGFRLSGGVRAQCVIGHRDGPGRAVPVCAA